MLETICPKLADGGNDKRSSAAPDAEPFDDDAGE
jgi:hypothetical protein